MARRSREVGSMTMMIAARIMCVLIASASAVLALQPPQAHSEEQTAAARHAPNYGHQQEKKMNAWTVGLVESAPPLRLAANSMCAAPIWRLSVPVPARCLGRANAWNAWRNSPATSRRRDQRCHRARTSAGAQQLDRHRNDLTHIVRWLPSSRYFVRPGEGFDCDRIQASERAIEQ